MSHWSSLAVVISLSVAVLPVVIFQCHPVRHMYDKTIPGKCINLTAFYVSTAAINLLTDIMILSIPIIITARLHILLRRKIAVCIVLCMGVAAAAVAIWRIIMLLEADRFRAHGPDPTYSISFCSSVIEINVAVIAACAPSMKAISTRFLPRLLGNSRKRSSDKCPYDAGASSGMVGSRIFRIPHIFTKSTSRTRTSMYSAPTAAPVDWPRDNVGSSDERFDLRKYRRGTDSWSILYLTDDDDHASIMKTTEISVGYDIESVGNGSSSEGRVVSVESMV
ncbi:hypothetical protein N7535_007491 [Penicillium sp. DV-2018c]|nr:hypothetical protein N7535_007491 [Penicillium sp. DV-2018c]